MCYRRIVLCGVWAAIVFAFHPGLVLADESGLVNPGFEHVEDGKLAGWTILTGLDGHRYGEPDFKQTFNDIRPAQGSGGFGSPHCLGFPREGTWTCPVWAHSNGDGRGINGKELGKAVAYQTVPLGPGRHQFVAHLRSAAGDLHSASFSLGVSLGDAPVYRHDGSSGIQWTHGLAQRRSEIGGKGERGEWMRYATVPFELREAGPATVWIRFNYANENQFRARWQADDVAIVPAAPRAADQASAPCACVLPPPVRHREFCGDRESFLVDGGASRVVEVPEMRLLRHARELRPGHLLKYRFPTVANDRPASLLVKAAGKLKVSVGKQEYPFESQTGQPAAFEWPVIQDAADDVVAVEVEATGSETARLYELELSSPGRTAIRVSRVIAQTVAVPWRVGTWDGSDDELTQRGPHLSAPGPEPSGSTTDSAVWRLRFKHEPRPGHRYWLVYGLIRGECRIDVGGDTIVDWIARTTGEEIVDVDVTDMLEGGDNLILIETQGEHDFAALVEACPGSDDLRDAQLVFEGDPLAETVSRTAMNTWFWLRELHYEPTGFVDASVPFGKWFNQYWPIDTAFALREWVGWGLHEEARNVARFSAQRGWQGHSSNRSGGHDNTGGNILVRQFCEIVRRSELDDPILDDLWRAIEAHAGQMMKDASASPFGLVRGTNWENAGNLKHGPCYALSTSLGGALSLRQAAMVADRLGKQEKARQWREAAGRTRQAVLEHLVLKAPHRCPSGFEMPAGTWAYGLRMDGAIEDQPLAGFFWAGAGLGEVEGLIPADREVLEVYDRTLAAALPLFDGKREEVVSGYAASYDGPDVSLVLAALCDRVSALLPLLRHVAEGCGAGDKDSATQAELSPWTVGKGGWVEDTNLVGAAGFLWPLRILAGIDDAARADRGQLVLVPRLPWEWNGVRVKEWPVRCLDATHRERWAKLSYELHRTSTEVEFLARADALIPAVRVRLGPFPATVQAVQIRVNGREVDSQLMRSADAVWAWLEADIAGNGTRIRVLAR